MSFTPDKYPLSHYATEPRDALDQTADVIAFLAQVSAKMDGDPDFELGVNEANGVCTILKAAERTIRIAADETGELQAAARREAESMTKKAAA